MTISTAHHADDHPPHDAVPWLFTKRKNATRCVRVCHQSYHLAAIDAARRLGAALEKHDVFGIVMFDRESVEQAKVRLREQLERDRG